MSTIETSPAAPLVPATDRIASRVPFFYGWAMLPMAMIAQIATFPGQTFGIAFFNQSFRTSLGLSGTQISTAYMFGTLLAAVPLLYVGRLMDVYGIRRTMTAIVVLFGGACLAASQAQGILTLFLTFFLLRSLGQGALGLLAGNTLPMWFHRRLGTAMGIMSLGMACTMAMVPALVLGLIDAFTWRWAYVILGGLIWLVMLPLLAVGFRNRPEDIGQRPDGDSLPIDEDDPPAVYSWHGHDLAAAAKTRSFWILLALVTTWGMVGTAMVFHITGVFQSRGLTTADAAAAFATFATCLAVMQPIGGLLADRMPLNRLLSVGVAGMALGVAMLAAASGTWTWLAYAVFGASQGSLGAVFNTVWARYFGRAHLGKIRGIVQTSAVAGTSLGPFLMGLDFELNGSYGLSLTVFASLFFLLVIAAWFATPPEPQPIRRAESARF